MFDKLSEPLTDGLEVILDRLEFWEVEPGVDCFQCAQVAVLQVGAIEWLGRGKQVVRNHEVSIGEGVGEGAELGGRSLGGKEPVFHGIALRFAAEICSRNLLGYHFGTRTVEAGVGGKEGQHRFRLSQCETVER